MVFVVKLYFVCVCLLILFHRFLVRDLTKSGVPEPKHKPKSIIPYGHDDQLLVSRAKLPFTASVDNSNCDVHW